MKTETTDAPKQWHIQYRHIPMSFHGREECITPTPSDYLVLAARGTKRPILDFRHGVFVSRPGIERVYVIEGGQRVIHYEDGQLSLKNYLSQELAGLVPDVAPDRRAD